MITLCVCSARPDRVTTNLAGWRAALRADDELLVVLDGSSPAGWAGWGAGARVVYTGRERGLSAARMVGLDAAGSAWVVFVDDDALVSAATLEAIRDAFTAGAHAVGVRLVPHFVGRSRPRYLTDGLLHYVGVHSARTVGSVWGACFGVERGFVQAHGLAFRRDLGRRGRQLQSGDDTSFVARVRECGGTVAFLADSTATHQIAAEKCHLTYLIRRAWWQGRSEARRTNLRHGLAKELRRFSDGGPRPVRLVVLLVFGIVVAAGAAYELTARSLRAFAPATRG